MRAAKALVRFVDDAVFCTSCRASRDPSLKFISIQMTYPPAPEGCEWVLDEAEVIHLCEQCVRTAARLVGVFRDPQDDPGVLRLQEAERVATERLDAAHVEQSGLLERVRALEAEVG